MTNAYADITTLKSTSHLNITGTTFDIRLRQLLETVSRQIDGYCNRHFFSLETTRTFDGNGFTELHIPDLISVTSLKTDDNVDRTYETTWATTDYLLYPQNADPTQRWGSPYTRVLVDLEAGTRSRFQVGNQTVQIAGKWGYKEFTEDSGADINQVGGLNSSDTSVTVTDGSKFDEAQTIRIDSEQLYITGTSTLTVIRGVNGTTATSHVDASDINVFRYPDPVTQACLMQAARLWKRKDVSLATRGQTPYSRSSEGRQPGNPRANSLQQVLQGFHPGIRGHRPRHSPSPHRPQKRPIKGLRRV